jgi:enoyl-CoA hydratase/carnithine racemase
MANDEHSDPKAPRRIGDWKNVLVDIEDGIAWVTLNRPEKRNCMNPALNREMIEVLDAIEVDDSAGVLVLTGAGKAFSAGMDLKEFFRDTDDLCQQMQARRSCSSGNGGC